jgi:nucleotide-binding universal stress UspA family protein
MYRTVLLCYDGSVEGRNALREGADVAIAMHADTHLLAILRSLEGMNVPEALSAAVFEDEERMAQGILDEGVLWLREHGLHATGHVSFGAPVEVIGHCARELKADLVVLGHQRQSAIARWWSDSESAVLLDAAPCSVLVACLPQSR